MKQRFRWLVVAAGAIVAGLIVATATKRRTQISQMSTVPSVDLARYAGRWYEVARLPNEFQKKCAGDVSADYIIRPDGKVDVVNQCRQEDGTISVARGVARSADPETNAKLEVRFAPAFLAWLPVVWGNYWVIGLDENYRWAVVGEPTRKYGWILSRTPEIAAVDWNAAVAVLRDYAYNPTLFIRTIHAAH
jgi:apolipoprotein D and lipocalin family protein